MRGGNIGAYKRLFPAKHIPTILLLIVEAGSSLRKKTEHEREDHLTRRLYKQLIKAPVFRNGPLDIVLQPEIPLTGQDVDASSFGRIDLLVSCARGHEVYFAIEAKRLRFYSAGGGKLYSGAGEYIREGMMRFVTGKYAPYMEESAMLGYVFDGELDKARSDVDKSIRNNATALRLASPGCLARSSILPEAGLDETKHDLPERSFAIYHIFVPV